MSPAQQRGLALWAALLSAVVCLGFLPVSRLVSVLILLTVLGLIIAFWSVASRRAEQNVILQLDDLPEASYRQPVVLVCGDLPLACMQQSGVRSSACALTAARWPTGHASTSASSRSISMPTRRWPAPCTKPSL